MRASMTFALIGAASALPWLPARDSPPGYGAQSSQSSIGDGRHDGATTSANAPINYSGSSESTRMSTVMGSPSASSGNGPQSTGSTLTASTDAVSTQDSPQGYTGPSSETLSANNYGVPSSSMATVASSRESQAGSSSKSLSKASDVTTSPDHTSIASWHFSYEGEATTNAGSPSAVASTEGESTSVGAAPSVEIPPDYGSDQSSVGVSRSSPATRRPHGPQFTGYYPLSGYVVTGPSGGVPWGSYSTDTASSGCATGARNGTWHYPGGGRPARSTNTLYTTWTGTTTSYATEVATYAVTTSSLMEVPFSSSSVISGSTYITTMMATSYVTQVQTITDTVMQTFAPQGAATASAAPPTYGADGHGAGLDDSDGGGSVATGSGATTTSSSGSGQTMLSGQSGSLSAVPDNHGSGSNVADVGVSGLESLTKTVASSNGSPTDSSSLATGWAGNTSDDGSDSAASPSGSGIDVPSTQAAGSYESLPTASQGSAIDTVPTGSAGFDANSPTDAPDFYSSGTDSASGSNLSHVFASTTGSGTGATNTAPVGYVASSSAHASKAETNTAAAPTGGSDFSACSPITSTVTATITVTAITTETSAGGDTT